MENTDKCYLTDYEIKELIDTGVIVNGNPENINASSLDLHLDTMFKKVRKPGKTKFIRMDKSPEYDPIFEEHSGYVALRSGECVLAASKEIFNLPTDISFDVCLRSTAGRRFINHMLAGHADAGWNGSALTLEFKNELPEDYIWELFEGDRVVQIRLYRHNHATFADYSKKGSYNDSGAGPTEAGK